jgi:hypothetical protein
MPSLQARVAARGFPVFDLAGQSGQGALPDSTLPSGPPAGAANPAWSDPNNDPGWQPTGIGPPEPYITAGMFGLPGGFKDDDTPRTHAAPIYDSTLPRGVDYIEADATHAPVFNGITVRRPSTQAAMQFSQQITEGNGESNLEPVKGQLRAMGKFDGVQGYGGGGPGPGGTNLPELTVHDRQFPGPNSATLNFVNAAEVPLYVPSALQFIPQEPAMGPWLGGNYDVPTVSTHAQDVIPADTPTQGPPVFTPAVAASSSFWA